MILPPIYDGRNYYIFIIENIFDVICTLCLANLEISSQYL